ncbi:hypothetical protein KY362_06885, partial [Candidatus Woesearchaeota archaeon]|nr:hypothetical protein [Candidatus Woesearchaeota archaeon]
YQTGFIHGKSVVFLLRHGPEHDRDPAHISDLDNMLVMHHANVQLILGISATGIVDHDRIKVGDVVFPDQIFRYNVSQPSFFGNGTVVHIPYAKPVCEQYLSEVKLLLPVLNAKMCEKGLKSTVHSRGTSVVADGPGFSTEAESEFFQTHLERIVFHYLDETDAKTGKRKHIARKHKAAVIGMTIKEAYAARGIACYLNIAHATDEDNPPAAYRHKHGAETVDQEKVSAQAAANKATLETTISFLIENLPELQDCSCRHYPPESVIAATPKAPETVLRLLWERGAMDYEQFKGLMHKKGLAGIMLPPLVRRAKTLWHDHLGWRLGMP